MQRYLTTNRPNSGRVACYYDIRFPPRKDVARRCDYVYPTLEQSTRTLRVRLPLLIKITTLKPNVFAQMTIHSDMD